MGRKVYDKPPKEETEEERQQREMEHNAWLFRPMTADEVRTYHETMRRRRYLDDPNKKRTRKSMSDRAIRESME